MEYKRDFASRHTHTHSPKYDSYYALIEYVCSLHSAVSSQTIFDPGTLKPAITHSRMYWDIELSDLIDVIACVLVLDFWLSRNVEA